MDPWWNPAIQQQAIDRVHRLGQTKTVTVVQFLVKDTIEERIMELQEKKRQQATAVLSKEKIAGGNKLTEADLRLLFS